MLFENAFCEDFKYYARVFDEKTNRSMKIEIDGTQEGFEPDNTGIYHCILDKSVKLRKIHGRSKDMHGKYGVTGPIYRFIRDGFWKDHKYNTHPRIWYLDIETRAETAPDPVNTPNEIILIQFYDTFTKTEYVLGRKPWKPEDDYKYSVPVKYIEISSEYDLIDAFFRIFQKQDPLIIYAWNGEGFDFPYIFNRAKMIGISPERMSNYGLVTLKPVQSAKGLKYTIGASGHYYVDLLDVYKKFTFSPRSSYSLENIASIELQEHKVDHTEYLDFDSAYTGKNYQVKAEPYDDRIREEIRQLRIRMNNGDTSAEAEYYSKVNFMFVHYGIQDVVLLKKIDEKLGFTNICLGIAQMMGVQMSDSLGTVKPWSQYIANVAYFQQLVFPPRQEFDAPSIVGGFVKQPVPGKYNWVANLDVNSMYPQLSIAGFNMSPDTYIPKGKLPAELRDLVLRYYNDQDETTKLSIPEDIREYTSELLQKYNVCLAPNGAVFSKDHEGIVPKLVNEIYDGRKKDKKTMIKYENRKVLIGEILSKRGIKITN